MNQRSSQRRPKTNSNTLSSFGNFEFLNGGYTENYVKAFNDKIKISELFERNRLTQKVSDGPRRRNYNSDRHEGRQNPTPSYLINANNYFNDPSAIPL